MRYKARFPPTNDVAALADFVAQEMRLVEIAIQALYDGILEPTREFPPRDDPVLKFGDESFDLGDGAGLYLRIGSQWYKLQMTPVSGLFPSTANINLVGNTPTVSVT